VQHKQVLVRKASPESELAGNKTISSHGCYKKRLAEEAFASVTWSVASRNDCLAGRKRARTHLNSRKKEGKSSGGFCLESFSVHAIKARLS